MNKLIYTQISLTTLLTAVFAALAPSTASAIGTGGSSCSASCLYSTCSIKCRSGQASCGCTATGATCTCSGSAATARAFPDEISANTIQSKNLHDFVEHFGASGTQSGAALSDLGRDMLLSINGGDVEGYTTTLDRMRETLRAADAQTLRDVLAFNGTLDVPSMCGSTEVNVDVGVDGTVEQNVSCAAIRADGAVSFVLLAGLMAFLKKRAKR